MRFAFAEHDPIKAELVKRAISPVFADQAAEALGISAATADRYWAYARAWPTEIAGGDASAPGGLSHHQRKESVRSPPFLAL
jgi:hypothetical protein